MRKWLRRLRARWTQWVLDYVARNPLLSRYVSNDDWKIGG